MPQPAGQQAGVQNPTATSGTMPPAMQIPQAIRNYGDYYAASAMDPHKGNYGGVMQDFAAVVAGGSQYNPQTLFARVTAASSHDVPMALAVHCKDMADANDTGRIQLVHRVTAYPLTVVGNPQPWDGNSFGYWSWIRNYLSLANPNP